MSRARVPLASITRPEIAFDSVHMRGANAAWRIHVAPAELKLRLT